MAAPGYSAPLWLRNAHVQSVLSSIPFRRSAAQRVLERTGARTVEHVVDAGDGVRLLGFHDSVPGRDPRALVLLLHGWEGSSESAYMRLTAARLITQGFDVFRLNFRDHGDTHHLNEGLFHSCRLAEVVAAAKDVNSRWASLPFLAAGYSLGGNFVLRLALAAPAAGLPLRHAAAVCPAVDPSAVMRTLETGSPLYNWYFMKKWRDSLRKKRQLWPQHVDVDETVLKQDMRSLTRWLALKHTEFTDVEDYFEGYSVSGGRLAALQVPVSVLASADDPVIPVDTLRTLELPAHSRLDIAEHGGHCGFIEGPSLRGYAERWVAKRLSRALSAHAAADDEADED